MSGGGRRIATVALVVRDHDEAIAWYTAKLRFRLFEDVGLGDGRRWVTLGPPEGGLRLLLAEAKNDDERSRIGNQTGGRVFLFLTTDNFDRDHRRMVAMGIEFEELPREESYGKVAVWRDPFGNRWDLLQLN